MNETNMINPASTKADMSRILNPNIFDKMNQENEKDDEKKREIRIRKGIISYLISTEKKELGASILQ